MTDPAMWNPQSLNDLLTVIAEVMPHPDAEKVIAVCLTKAALQTWSEGLHMAPDAISIEVHHDPDEPWNADTVKATINGVKLKIEVSLDG